MGYVGAGFVANQANTTDGGAINTVAYASTGASAGQGVGGSSAVNLYTGPNGTLLLDFINNYYATNGSSKTFAQTLTFTRSSSQTYFDSTGTLQTAAANTAAFDYNPSTLAARGLSMWEARTNSIRNNTMVGAVAGSPGTVPTNWSRSTYAGMSIDVIGTGVESGITYIDCRFIGTGGAASHTLNFDTTTAIAASTGQNWTLSSFVRIISGTTSGVTGIRLVNAEFTSGGAFVASQITAIIPSSASLSSQRYIAVQTLSGGATTAFVVPSINLTYTNGAAIDITLRIGMPQLELGAFATPVIATTNAAAARTAPTCRTADLSWFNATEGTFVVNGRSFNNAATGGMFYRIQQNADTTRRMQTYIAGSNISFLIVDGTNQANITHAYTQGVVVKHASAYANNNAITAMNGVLGALDSSCSIPTGLDNFLVGEASATTIINGEISSIQYYRQRQPDAVLQALSQ